MKTSTEFSYLPNNPVEVFCFEKEQQYWSFAHEVRSDLNDLIHALEWEAMQEANDRMNAIMRKAMLKNRVEDGLASTEDIIEYYCLQ